MVEITAMTYEQVRSKYFEEQMQKAQRRMKYWEARIDRTRPDNLMDEAHGKAADAGWEYNFYKDALEALAAQPKWISVEERSPERGVYFVRCIHNYTDNDEYECHKVAIYLSEEYRWIDVGNLLKVTHWMPIPALPKEGE